MIDGVSVKPRAPAVVAIAAAVALLCTGMALATAGVIVGGLFLPGVILIGLGLLASAAAAVLRLMRPQPESTPLARRA